jgi:CheY-like chemotaxis protein
MTTQHIAERKARRVLIVDDTPDIHTIFRKVFASPSAPESSDERELRALEETLFDGDAAAPRRRSGPDLRLEVVSAYQGEEAIALARAAAPPFFLAFVDMRMPPGIDGIATIKGLWSVDPGLYVVICSAYSDHDWEDISRELGFSPNLLILRKPFESIEILQIAVMVTAMYDALAALRASTAELEERLVQFGELADRERRRSRALMDALATHNDSRKDGGEL